MLSNRIRLGLFSLLSIVVSACTARAPLQDHVVTERYIHKYDVELTPEEWMERGKDGQVIKVLGDGSRVCENYSKGVLQGETSCSFPHSDIIHSIKFYSRGTLVKELLNHPTGKPEREVKYQDDGSKKITVWYDNASPKQVEIFQQDRLISGNYYSPSSQMESQVNQGSGTRVVRDIYGQLISKDVIQDGFLKEITTYHPNGSPSMITPFHSNLPHGEKRIYLPSGEPEAKEEWQYGTLHGCVTTYLNGERAAEIPYVNGVKFGIERRFKDGETVVEEITWNHDIRHGPSMLFIEGEVKTQWYYKGAPVSHGYFEQMEVRSGRVSNS